MSFKCQNTSLCLGLQNKPGTLINHAVRVFGAGLPRQLCVTRTVSVDAACFPLAYAVAVFSAASACLSALSHRAGRSGGARSARAMTRPTCSGAAELQPAAAGANAGLQPAPARPAIVSNGIGPPADDTKGQRRRWRWPPHPGGYNGAARAATELEQDRCWSVNKIGTIYPHLEPNVSRLKGQGLLQSQNKSRAKQASFTLHHAQISPGSMKLNCFKMYLCSMKYTNVCCILKIY